MYPKQFTERHITPTTYLFTKFNNITSIFIIKFMKL